MKRALCVATMIALSIPFSALARLRVLGRIGDIGMVDGNSDHIAFTLVDGAEWGAVISTNGGATWAVANKEAMPTAQHPLPSTGEVRYQVVNKEIVLRSTDAGETWCDISPWSFLSGVIRENVKGEKERFLAKYGARLPDDGGWFIMFGCTALTLCAFSAGVLRRKRQQWLIPIFVSVVHYLFIGIVLFVFHYVYANEMRYGQWEARLGHWNPVMVPLWPMGVALHMCGNISAAPITAVLCFPMTCLFWNAVPASSSRVRRYRLLGVVAVGLVLALFVASFVFGIGFEY